MKKTLSLLLCIIALTVFILPVTAFAANPTSSAYSYDVSFYRADYFTSHNKYYGSDIGFTQYYQCEETTARAKTELQRNKFLYISFETVGSTYYDSIASYYGKTLVFYNVNINTLNSYRWLLNADNNNNGSGEVPITGRLEAFSGECD